MGQQRPRVAAARFGGLIAGLIAVASIFGCSSATTDESEAEFAASTQPVPTDETVALTIATITPDGDDHYVIERLTDGFSVRSPESNVGGNLRIAVIDPAAPVLVDQQSCLDWHGPSGWIIQDGVVLRARVGTDRTQAVMVSNNIFFAARQAFNVHMVDTNGLNDQGTGPGPNVHPKIAAFDMKAGVGDLLEGKPLPWRICARVIGRELTVKVWSVPSFSQEPSWSDPVYAQRVTLPEQSVYPGQPGAYVGHIKPGEHTEFRHLVAGPVPAEASTPDPPTASTSPATTGPPTTMSSTARSTAPLRTAPD